MYCIYYQETWNWVQSDIFLRPAGIGGPLRNQNRCNGHKELVANVVFSDVKVVFSDVKLSSRFGAISSPDLLALKDVGNDTNTFLSLNSSLFSTFVFIFPRILFKMEYFSVVR